MTDIAPHLERLGLEQYLDAFVGEGFDSWETLLDIQESDFDALNVKLGHRRKLQRAIADSKGISYERLIGSPAQEGLQEGGRSFESGIAPLTNIERTSGLAPETKRKYRRHPKPDENAPERPPSAYVIFSNKVREEVKDQNLSFTQIAKLVGDRWQKLDPAGKEPFEAQANAAKARYNIQLSTYRKTDAYKEYMQYLSEFKAKQGQTSDQKRPRLEPESSGSIVSSKSLENYPDVVSSHVRGGSMGSVASSPYISAPAQSSGSLPSGTVPSRPPLPSSRSGSPPSLQQTRESFRSGFISSHSSVSDESSTVRSELPDPLMRTATLTLGSTSGTPPLQPLATSASSVDPVGSPDLFARSRLAYYTQLQQSAPSAPPAIGGGQPSGSSPSFQLPLPSPTMQEAAWRNRLSEARTLQEANRTLQPAMSFAPGQQQLSPSHLPPLMSTDRFTDITQPSNSRTLPPFRAPGIGVSSLTHLGRPTDQPRPFTTEPLQGRLQGQDERRPALEASESDAANTLAGLAAGLSRPGTTKPSNQPPPRPPP